MQLVGYLCYWQMGFNSVFKGLKILRIQICTSFAVKFTYVFSSKNVILTRYLIPSVSALTFKILY
jgi:hypothetical protein